MALIIITFADLDQLDLILCLTDLKGHYRGPYHCLLVNYKQLDLELQRQRMQLETSSF
jgi:hypothetical protein